MAQNKRMFATRAALLKEIEHVAANDVKHYGDVKNVIAGCVLHASDHGDLDPLSIFYRAVSQATKGVIRRSVLTVINGQFGKDYPIANNPFPLISFEKNRQHILPDGRKGPDHGKETFFWTPNIMRGEQVLLDDEKTKEIRNNVRNAISAVDEATLTRFIDANETANTDRIPTLPVITDDLAKVIKRHAQTHATPKGVLVELNKIVKNIDKEKALDVESLWDKGQNPTEWNEDRERELERMLRAKERATKAMEEAQANAKAEKPKEQAAA